MKRGTVLLVLVLSVGWGCSDDPAGTPDTSSAGEQIAPAGDDAVAAAAESDTGDMVFVHGTSGGSECAWAEQESQRDDDPATIVYRGTLRCRSDMSDPRVSGIEEWHFVEPFFYTEFVGDSPTGRFEASTTLDTGDGVWRGSGFGADLWAAGQTDLRTAFFVEYAGEGAYEGLVYRAWGAQHPGSDGYMIVGYIQPAE